MSATKLMPNQPPRYDRLLKLADFLDGLPEPLFNFRTWVQVGKLPHDLALQKGGGCGTTACAVGWLPAVFPDDVVWVQDGIRLRAAPLVPSDDLYKYEDQEAAMRFFNLSESQSDYLFLPCGMCGDGPLGGQECQAAGKPRQPRWQLHNSRLLASASAREVALHIRTWVGWEQAKSDMRKKKAGAA